VNINELTFQNRHWSNESLLSSSPYSLKRPLFDLLRDDYKQRFVLTLSGLRRVGKSVLARQLLEHWYASVQQDGSSFPSNRVLTFSFENDDRSDLLPQQELSDLLTIYFRDILQTHPEELTEKVFICLDEVQNVKGWQSVIKLYYDLTPHIKFLITGSSTLYLNEGVESLAGRVLDYDLQPLSFREFLTFSNTDLEVPDPIPSLPLRGVVPLPVSLRHIEFFEEFLHIGGFPDTAIMFRDGASREEIQHFVRKSIVDKIVHRDLKKYFHVKDSSYDQRLFELCCRESGMFLVLSNIAATIGLSKPTVAEHLRIFEQSALLKRLEKYDSSLRKVIAHSRKAYVTSPTLILSTLFGGTHIDSLDLLGHVAEGYAAMQLSSNLGKLFVDLPRQQQEVDFYSLPKKLMIECKYSGNFDPRKFAYLTRRAHRKDADAIALTKRHWHIDERLSAIPLMFI
jgi:predicted AAA+ superfamily ATPase